MDEAGHQDNKTFADEARELSDWLCLESPMKDLEAHKAIAAMTYALGRALSNLPSDEDAKVTAEFIRDMVKLGLKLRKKY